MKIMVFVDGLKPEKFSNLEYAERYCRGKKVREISIIDLELRTREDSHNLKQFVELTKNCLL